MRCRSERMPSNEHHQLQLEEDHGVNGGTTPLGVQVPRPLPDEAQVELGFQVPIRVVHRDQVLQGDGDRQIKAAGFGRAEHRAAPLGEPVG